MLVPVFLAEASPAIVRGRLVGMYEISNILGSVVGFWISFGVARTMTSSSPQWIVPFGVQLIPGGLLVIGLFFLGDSPS